MLGRPSPSRRETLKTRHLSRETVRQPRRQARDSSAPPPSVRRKFEEHDKRKVIDEFLRTPKKSSVNLENVPLRLQTARERKVTVVNAMRSPDKKISTASLASDLPPKPDLGDIIIAAAAAKMVKLDPTVPEPSLTEVGKQYCRKMLHLCHRGQGEAVGEILKVSADSRVISVMLTALS